MRESIIQYLQEIKKSESRKEIFVPEINEMIYFSPVTVLEQERIFAQSNGAAQSKDFHLATIVEKAETKEGDKLFKMEDKPILEQMPWRVITRVSNAIQGDYSIKEAKKN